LDAALAGEMPDDDAAIELEEADPLDPIAGSQLLSEGGGGGGESASGAARSQNEAKATGNKARMSKAALKKQQQQQQQVNPSSAAAPTSTKPRPQAALTSASSSSASATNAAAADTDAEADEEKIKFAMDVDEALTHLAKRMTAFRLVESMQASSAATSSSSSTVATHTRILALTSAVAKPSILVSASSAPTAASYVDFCATLNAFQRMIVHEVAGTISVSERRVGFRLCFVRVLGILSFAVSSLTASSSMLLFILWPDVFSFAS
jgi:hypothetical protein